MESRMGYGDKLGEAVKGLVCPLQNSLAPLILSERDPLCPRERLCQLMHLTQKQWILEITLSSAYFKTFNGKMELSVMLRTHPFL